jgi:hypothetical protein
VLKEGGAEKLQILADYDRTISPEDSDTTFNSIMHSHILPDSWRKKNVRDYEYYYPLEKKNGIGLEEKILLSEEWSNENKKCYQKYLLSVTEAEQALKGSNTKLRHHAKEFFKICE